MTVSQGSCFNERGSPLYTVERRSNASVRAVASLVGVASVDGDCDRENSVFTATDFQAYLPWITELMLGT